MPYHGPVKGMISIADNKFRRNTGAHKYRERILAEIEELFVTDDRNRSPRVLPHQYTQWTQ